MRLVIQDRHFTLDTSEDYPEMCNRPDEITLLNVKGETEICCCESKTNEAGRPEVTLTMRELWTLLDTYQATRQETTRESE